MRAITLLCIVCLGGCATGKPPATPAPSVAAAVPMLRIVQHPSGLFVWCTECPPPTLKSAPATVGMAWLEQMANVGATADVLALANASSPESFVSDDAGAQLTAHQHESLIPAVVAQFAASIRR